MVQIGAILGNTLSGHWPQKTKLGDLLDGLEDLSPYLAQKNVFWAVAFCTMFVGVF